MNSIVTLLCVVVLATAVAAQNLPAGGAVQNKKSYESLREEILAWHKQPANNALCGTDPEKKLDRLITELETCDMSIPPPSPSSTSSSSSSRPKRMTNGCRRTDSPPFEVAVMTITKLECTGTLVTDRHVTVAAKCFEHLTSPSQIKVLVNSTKIEKRFGEENSTNDKNVHDVINFGNHPYFKANFENNVGILELAAPVQISSTGVRPICIATQPVDVENLKNCLMSSFGLTKAPSVLGNKYVLPNMRWSLFNGVAHKECESVYPIYLHERQICARGAVRAGSSSKDAAHMCVGDFGAGLQCKLPPVDSPNTLKWTMIGMASYTAADCKGPAAFNNMWTGFAAPDSNKPAVNGKPGDPTTTPTPPPTPRTRPTPPAWLLAMMSTTPNPLDDMNILQRMVFNFQQPFKTSYAAVAGALLG